MLLIVLIVLFVLWTPGYYGYGRSRWNLGYGGHKFYEELGPMTRSGTHDRAAIAALFAKYDMTLLGPPLTAD